MIRLLHLRLLSFGLGQQLVIPLTKTHLRDVAHGDGNGDGN